MSFGSTLLGKPSHDALLKLQDNEIKLLEAIKRTLAMRIRSEKDYSQSLTQQLAHNMKLDVPCYNSFVYNAWKAMVSDISETAKSLRKRADDLQRITERVGCLIKEKVAVRKSYLKNRDRIDNELLKVIHSKLNQKQSLCAKQENDATNAHKNYDQVVSKGKLSAVERAQDKYRKDTMKLYNYHNEYALQVEEAKMHQTAYRSNTLPELLNGLEYLETEFVETIKTVFSDYLRCTSPCCDEIVSRQKLTEDKTHEIDSAKEYQSFVDCHKTCLENEAVINFIPLSGEGAELPQGQILLNRFTLQGIENLASDYVDDIEIVEEQIEENKQLMQQLSTELSDQSSDDDSAWFSKQQAIVQTKLAINEQEDMLSRLKHLHGLVSEPLKSLQGRDPPPGLVLPDLDTESVSSPFYTPSDVSVFTYNIKKKINSISFPFSSSKSSQDESKGSLSPVMSPRIDSPRIPPRSPSTASNYVLPSNSPMDSSKPIQEQTFFHGATPRHSTELLLLNDGDFLFRQCKRNKDAVVLSTFSNSQHRHFILSANSEGNYPFGGKDFPSIYALVTFVYRNNSAFTRKLSISFLNAVEKDKWQLSHDAIDLKEKLGEGNYGTVHRGYMKTGNQNVAVKTCHDTVDSITKSKFLMEARILKSYDHRNIVKLIGVATEKHPIYIVMELVSGGDLRNYLRKRFGGLQQNKLVALCRDACAGLEYLEQKNCIHRDVAARNCLVTDHNVVKISDFGMSREEDDGIYTMSGGNKKVPIKWTAPEAICYGKFTSASDVWSFGILSWEVFSYGKLPYPGMTNAVAYGEITSGYRMPQQSGCPDRYYRNAMRPCWYDDPDERPRFSDLLAVIASI